MTVFISFSTFLGARTSRILATNDSTPASPASISPPEWGLDNFSHRESGQYNYGDNDYSPACNRFLCASEDYSTSSKEISFASISFEQKMKYFIFSCNLLFTRSTEANQCSNTCIVFFHIQCNKGITYHNFSSIALVSFIHVKTFRRHIVTHKIDNKLCTENAFENEMHRFF